jgi:hypothetical protein
MAREYIRGGIIGWIDSYRRFSRHLRHLNGVIFAMSSPLIFFSTLMLLGSINVGIPSLGLVKTLNSVPHLYFFSHIGLAGIVANAAIAAKFFAGLIFLSSLLISAMILK